MSEKHLSENWPSRYHPDTLTRRGSEPYSKKMADYTRTSQRVGEVRQNLLAAAVLADFQPPLTKHDIRTGARAEEIQHKLGQIGTDLLIEHVEVDQANRTVMRKLRDEANRLYAQITGTESFKG